MNKRILAVLVLVGLASMGMKCNINLSGSPTQVNEDRHASASPSPGPSVSPSPGGVTPTPTPNPCSFDGLEAKLKENDPFIVKGQRLTLDLTPTQDGIDIADSCNTDPTRLKTLEWFTRDKSICQVIGTGYNPPLLANAVSLDGCEVWATLKDEFRKSTTVESNHFKVEVR